MFIEGIDRDTAKRLQTLKQRIEKSKIPSSKLDETLNVATWNIRDFGKKKRTKAAKIFLAEILNQFDLIAITEVRDNLHDFLDVIKILGPYWKFVVSDFRPDRAGNRERVAYLYDERMCQFTGLAAEADPPRKKMKISPDRDEDYVAKYTWWRAPYMASFKAGNFDFTLLTAHMRWGSSESERETALANLADWIEKRRKNEHVFDKDIIVMGDFNIPKVGDSLYKALTKNRLKMPAALGTVKFTNVAGYTKPSSGKNYDQILHYPYSEKSFTSNGGILDFLGHKNGHKALFPDLTKAEFTYQLSDHFPLWLQIDCDVDGVYLDNVVTRNRQRRR